jgi:hypothetical protein
MIIGRTAHSVTLRTGDLTATIGDNASDPPGAPWSYFSLYDNEAELIQRPGYNGLWHLSSVHAPGNLFMAKVSGLNFENIFDGELQDDLRVHTLDPRRCPLEWAIDDGEVVRFSQPPTEYRGLESRWSLQLCPPHYVDLSFACTPTRPFPHGWFTVFWASYIANPTHPRMRFTTPYGQLVERPVSLDGPTVVPAGSRPLTTRPEWKERWLDRDQFALVDPYFVGIQQHMMYQVMVRTSGLPGFASRPSPGVLLGVEHIPWDFHVTFFDVEPGERYALEARAVYAPWEGEAQPRDEYARWMNQDRRDARPAERALDSVDEEA